MPTTGIQHARYGADVLQREIGKLEVWAEGLGNSSRSEAVREQLREEIAAQLEAEIVGATGPVGDSSSSSSSASSSLSAASASAAAAASSSRVRAVRAAVEAQVRTDVEEGVRAKLLQVVST
jgi:hypothetical protein